MTFIVQRSLFIFLSAALLSLVALAVPSHADSPVADELKSCSTIDDATSRLACYDRLSGRPLPSAATPPTTVVPRAASAGERAPATNESTVSSLSGRVTRCEKNASDQLVFHLDNGQVWQQSNHKRLNLSGCDFNVTLKKEFLGYKMRLEDSGRSVRVKRIR